VDVYLEVGTKRVFACAAEWPGWCRSGRDEASALEALADYGTRYRAAIVSARAGFQTPRDASAFTVVERVDGNATTDFGAPGMIPALDERPLDARETRRLAKLLDAAWTTFDSVVEAHAGVELRKGPRGGGRDVDRIVEHVFGGARGYLASLGGRYPEHGDMTGLCEAVRDTMQARAEGASLPARRSTKPPWPVRYFVRRSVWHILDHAWEIEDRAR
jgi:hypothetical protein